METSKKYRYPGINSFNTNDTDIFFGREDDRQKLADLVEIEKNVLLYSRSGLGKSSLLKAGLIPELSNRGFSCYYIRLGMYQKNGLPLVQNLLKRTILADQLQLPTTFLQKFISRSNSLWYVFKSMQIVAAPNDKPVVLIFDQFEEINSYPDAQLLNFKQQVAELLSTNIPQNYADALDDNNLLTEPFTDDELTLIYKPLRVKVVFSVRFDQVVVMNKFSDYLPNIQSVFYDLKPLSLKQARSAIEKPAVEPGNFITPAFIYQTSALKKILQSLDLKEKNEVDTAQLQILLQYIEQEIVARNNGTDINAENLGNLDNVYENYYHNSLKKLNSEKKQAQILIEDKLIAEKRRIQYDRSLCLQLVSQPTLDALIETRLLRQEPNTMGGFSYEISHDSLVAPILNAQEERKRNEEEDNRKAELEKQLAEQKKKRHQQLVIVNISVVAFIISFIFCVWAVIERKNADTEKAIANTAKDKAELAKATADMLLHKFIAAEIKRDNSELAKLKTDSITYYLSNDTDLVKETVINMKKLNDSIKVLNNRKK